MKYSLPACLILAAFLSAQTSEALNQEYREWRQNHAFPSSTDRAAQKKYGAELLKASDEWIRKYPGEFIPLHERFTALDMTDASKADLEAAGEALLKTGDRSLWLHVGRTWLKHDIRVREIPELVKKGLEDESAPTAAVRMSAWALITDVYLKLDQPLQARPWLDKMHDLMEKDEAATYRVQYYDRMALVAEKDQNKVDELTYLGRALMTGTLSETRVERARALWKEMGGSNEGWLAFSTPVVARPAATATVAATPSPAPNAKALVGKPLPEFSLNDLGGNSWTLASFQGKTTLVNVWATWCGPCRHELPNLQKLYNQVKDRQDVQIVTFNIDTKRERIEPFLKKNKYTFPVVPASAYVHKLLPRTGIPQTWIVDSKGTMREESVGFGGSGDQWVKNALAKLER